MKKNNQSEKQAGKAVNLKAIITNIQGLPVPGMPTPDGKFQPLTLQEVICVALTENSNQSLDKAEKLRRHAIAMKIAQHDKLELKDATKELFIDAINDVYTAPLIIGKCRELLGLEATILTEEL